MKTLIGTFQALYQQVFRRMSMTGGNGVKRCKDCGKRRPLNCYATTNGEQNAEAFCRDCRKLKDLENKWGIMEADVDWWFSRRGMKGLCGCCGKSLTKSLSQGSDGRWRVDWVVDHHHRSGEIRGFVCSGCNNGPIRQIDQGVQISRNELRELATEYCINPPFRMNDGHRRFQPHDKRR